MDNFTDLEAELKGLSLRRPSVQLVARLERELVEEMPEPIAPPTRPVYTSATNLGSWKWSGWRLAGLAAAVAFVTSVSVVSLREVSRSQDGITAGDPAELASTESGSAPAAENADRGETYVVPRRNAYQPVAATNVLYDVTDEGYVRAADDTAARRVRARYLDTYTWKNPENNASIKWSVPRDEVRVIPARWN